jgi:hypothetical protein
VHRYVAHRGQNHSLQYYAGSTAYTLSLTVGIDGFYQQNIVSRL